MTKKSSASTILPEYVILGFLNQQPAHGYDLHERIVRELGQIWHIRLSQTYNILNRLDAQGHITGNLQEQEKAPARRCFYLTSSGRRRFEAWLNAPTELSARAIRVEFLTRLYFAYTMNFEMVNLLAEGQIAALQSGMNRLQDILIDLPTEQTFNRLGLEMRIHQLASVLDWLKECQMRLTEPAKTKNESPADNERQSDT